MKVGTRNATAFNLFYESLLSLYRVKLVEDHLVKGLISENDDGWGLVAVIPGV